MEQSSLTLENRGTGANRWGARGVPSRGDRGSHGTDRRWGGSNRGFFHDPRSTPCDGGTSHRVRGSHTSRGGTVTAFDQAEQSVESGAAFLSSPGYDSDFLPLMQQTGLAVIPGVFTPSEVMLTRLLGAEALKLFPEPPRGSSYLKSLHDAFPNTLFPQKACRWRTSGTGSRQTLSRWRSAARQSVSEAVLDALQPRLAHVLRAVEERAGSVI